MKMIGLRNEINILLLLYLFQWGKMDEISDDKVLSSVIGIKEKEFNQCSCYRVIGFDTSMVICYTPSSVDISSCHLLF